MHASRIVEEMLSGCLSSLHARLAESVKAAVGGALRGGLLSLSQLARSLPPSTAMRHRVKRIDRLLGNGALHGARTEVYREVAVQWLSSGWPGWSRCWSSSTGPTSPRIRHGICCVPASRLKDAV